MFLSRPNICEAATAPSPCSLAAMRERQYEFEKKTTNNEL